MHKIGIIGGGNMGEAIIASCLKRFFIHVCEKDTARQQALHQAYRLNFFDIKGLAQNSDIIIIAVKPQDIEGALRELGEVLKDGTLVVSIAAGITTGYIERVLGKKRRVVRTMPNMPALIGQGVTAVCQGNFATLADVDSVCKVFNNLGSTIVVEEKFIDAVTAVSGSGPAYVFLFIEHLMKAAETLGLPKEMAKELVEKTFLGSVNLLLKQKIDAGVLRAKVTSKGGTTQAALKVFERKNLEKIFELALKAAKKRSKELSKA